MPRRGATPQEEIREEGGREPPRMEDEPPRRQEVTPTRRVMMAGDSPAAGGRTDATLGETPEETIRLLMQRVSLLEAEAVTSERYGTRRTTGPRYSTMSTTSEVETSSRQRPKLEKPLSFDGDYSPVQNVLNWVSSVEKYLRICQTDEDQFTPYARTYMGLTVQSWMDAAYGDTTPAWDDLVQALKKRYLPVDHEDRLEQKFESISQKSTLTEYVEQFQRLDAAMTNSDLKVRETRKIRQFIKGLSQVEDRRFILQQKCNTMQDVYEEVTILRQAKVMARGRESEEGRRKSKRLSKLEGKAKQDAWEKGLCLGCGSKDHFINKCPTTKKFERTLKRMEKYSSKKKHKPGQRKYNKMSRGDDKGSEEESSDSSEESDTSSDEDDQEETDSKEEGSGNQEPGV